MGFHLHLPISMVVMAAPIPAKCEEDSFIEDLRNEYGRGKEEELNGGEDEKVVGWANHMHCIGNLTRHAFNICNMWL